MKNIPMKQKIFTVLVALLALAVFVLTWRYASEPTQKSLKESLPITRYTLANDLTLLVVENHRMPAISHMLFVRAGAGDDPVGKSGVAHYVEHMLFMDVRGGKGYDRTIAALGGEANAYTTQDMTTYYVTAPKAALEQVMALESERMQALAVSEADGVRERKVIAEERVSRVDSDPAALLDEQMQAVQFMNSPYRRPTIGYAHEIAALTLEDVRAFLRDHYRPDHMTLVVAGDVEPKEIRRLAMRYFGSLKKEGVRPRQWPAEPPATYPRAASRLTFTDARVRQPQWLRYYTVPSLGTADAKEVVALEIAAAWLGAEHTGILYRELVEKERLALAVSADYSGTQYGPGTFTLSAVPAEGVTVEQVEQAMDAVLAQALSVGPEAAELKRAKTLYKAALVYAQDGLTQIATFVGTLQTLGNDPELFYALDTIVTATTAEEVASAARAGLRTNGSVTGVLLPQPPMEVR
jgi:zinc protease